MNCDTLHHVFCSMYDMNEPEESVFSLQSCLLGVNADDQARQILNKNGPNPMARRVVSHGKWTGIWQPTFHVASAGEESEKNANGQVVKDIRMSVVEIFPGF